MAVLKISISLIHHQYEKENLMPMTLACMKASKTHTEYLEDTRGRGWWGVMILRSTMKTLNTDCPWNWITVLPVMSERVQKDTGYDHAGKYESSILKALYPEAVKTERLSESDAWFIKSASECDTELGLKMVKLSVADLQRK